MSDLWQCDGCGETGSEDDLVRHIESQGEEVKCWSLMRVGGPAWQAFEFGGVHPIATVIAEIERFSKANGMRVFFGKE